MSFLGKIIIGIVCVNLVMAGGAWAADGIVATNQKANLLLKEKKAEEAYQLLLREYSEGKHDNQTLFLLGMAARDKGDLHEATKFFSELLEEVPQAGRVRLELARAYYELGDYEQAKRQFLIARSLNLPEKVGETVNKYLRSIDYGRHKKWNGLVTVGYMYDDNANTGPEVDSILVFGLPSVLSSDGQQSKDHAKLVEVQLDYVNPWGENRSWDTSLLLSVVDYLHTNDVDSKSISLSSGPVWQKGQATFSVPVVYNIVKLGRDYDMGEYYSTGVGLAPQVRYNLNDRWSSVSNIAYQNRHYRDNTRRDSDTGIVDSYLRYHWQYNGFVDVGTSWEDSHAEGDEFSYQLRRGYARLYKTIFEKYGMYLESSYGRSYYETNEPAFTDRRSDTIITMSMVFSYFVKQWNGTVSLEYHRTNNNSNIDIYEYDRDQYVLKFSKSF